MLFQAYSKVYKAKYKDAKVCVKVMSKTLADEDPNFFEYAEREISLLKYVFCCLHGTSLSTLLKRS